MTGAAPRQRNWTPDEDRRLLELLGAGKSWVFIAANLKRREKSVKYHARQLNAKADGPKQFREVKDRTHHRLKNERVE
jgi:DNA-binding NarL/FixJ family response regulator